MVWGLLPYDTKVSFEGHITGAVAGILLAIVYRKEGPAPEPSPFEDEEEDEPGPEELS